MRTEPGSTTPPPPAAHPLDRFREPLFGPSAPAALRSIDWVLRGIGQVVFQSNWLTGLLILAAIFLHSVPYGVAALVGVLTSTLTAVALRADRGLIDAGLFGFNGALVAIGLNAYLSADFTAGAFLDPLAYGYVLVAAALSTVLMAALGAFLGWLQVPALTAPFVFATWIFLFAVVRFAGIEHGPLDPSLPELAAGGSSYSMATWQDGILKGIGEIFFQDSWLAGAIILVAIAVNSRISAAMGLLGATLGVAVAVVLGAAETDVALGLYGFNAALTAMALGGFFLVLNVRSFLYALLGTLATVVAWAWLATFLSPTGMPTLTMPFVIITWVFLVAAPGLGGLQPVPPAEATFAENHLRRGRGPIGEEGRAPG